MGFDGCKEYMEVIEDCCWKEGRERWWEGQGGNIEDRKIDVLLSESEERYDRRQSLL